MCTNVNIPFTQQKEFFLFSKKEKAQAPLIIQMPISYSTISDWKHKNNNPAADKIMIICHILEVTPEYLLGEPDFTIANLPAMNFSCASNSQELRLVDYYRSLSSDGKQLLFSYLEALVRLNAEKANSDTPNGDE